MEKYGVLVMKTSGISKIKLLFCLLGCPQELDHEKLVCKIYRNKAVADYKSFLPSDYISEYQKMPQTAGGQKEPVILSSYEYYELRYHPARQDVSTSTMVAWLLWGDTADISLDWGLQEWFVLQTQVKSHSFWDYKIECFSGLMNHRGNILLLLS